MPFITRSYAGTKHINSAIGLLMQNCMGGIVGPISTVQSCMKPTGSFHLGVGVQMRLVARQAHPTPYTWAGGWLSHLNMR